MVRWKNGGCSAGLVKRRDDVRGGWRGRREEGDGRRASDHRGLVYLIRELLRP